MQEIATNPSTERLTVAFVFSLVAGLLVTVGAGLMASFSSNLQYHSGMMGSYGGMMNGYYGMMRGFGLSGWFYGLMLIGIISGIVIFLGAIMMYGQPSRTSTAGVLVLVFSIVSLFGMGGFFLGAMLGIVGGILAMTWR